VRLNAYPVEAAIAEKFEAMVHLDMLNSRMKDFYDIWILSRTLVDIVTDPFAVSKGLAKIAYLMTFRTLGDSFALSRDGKEYRDTIQAIDWDAFDGCKLQKFLGVDSPALPDIAIHEHLLACYRIGPMILTTVKLFGGVSLATFGISATPHGMSELDGIVVVADSMRRTFSERRLQEAVPLREMFERLQKQSMVEPDAPI
jgi:hypothetical protein